MTTISAGKRIFRDGVISVYEMRGALNEKVYLGFNAASKGTVADGAELVILEPSGQVWCMECAKFVAIARRGDPCPDCGGFKLRVAGGEELRVKEVEVE